MGTGEASQVRPELGGQRLLFASRIVVLATNGSTNRSKDRLLLTSASAKATEDGEHPNAAFQCKMPSSKCRIADGAPWRWFPRHSFSDGGSRLTREGITRICCNSVPSGSNVGHGCDRPAMWAELWNGRRRQSTTLMNRNAHDPDQQQQRFEGVHGISGWEGHDRHPE